jgi:hypothetical protein
VSGLYGVYDVKGVISGLSGGSLLLTLRDVLQLAQPVIYRGSLNPLPCKAITR